MDGSVWHCPRIEGTVARIDKYLTNESTQECNLKVDVQELLVETAGVRHRCRTELKVNLPTLMLFLGFGVYS